MMNVAMSLEGVGEPGHDKRASYTLEELSFHGPLFLLRLTLVRKNSLETGAILSNWKRT